MLLLIGGIILLVMFALMGLMMLSQKKMLTPESVMDFTKNNAKKGNVALTLSHGGRTIVDVNGQTPLAVANIPSTIVALAYAQKVADGDIQADETVPLKTLQAYHVPRLELDLHKDWLNEMRRAHYHKDVPLHEIAKGMIEHNSNANMEFLMHYIGIDAIQAMLKKLQLTKHDLLYPTSSALYIAEQHHLSDGEMNKLSIIDYRKKAFAIHKGLADESPSSSEKTTASKHSVDKWWQDRLPKATTREYVSLLKKLNNRAFFSADVLETMDTLFKDTLRTPELKKAIATGGVIAAGTNRSVSTILYATDAAGAKTELAFFATNLTPQEHMKLSMSVANFEARVVADPVFLERLKMNLA